MRAFAKGFTLASIVGALLLVPAVSGAQLLGKMRVRLAVGDVQVKIAETGEWAPVSVNMPLVVGDELWVPEGSLSAIQTNNGAYVRLDGNTALQVLRVSRSSFQFYLPQGRAYVLNNARTRSVLQFDTPDASIRTFGKSIFRVDIPNGETDVLVFRGSVTAENAGGTTRVRARSMLILGWDGYAELSPLPPPDRWQEWNERQDRIALLRGEGYRRLPEELRVYASDFDENGRWVHVPEYGYVWAPTVVVTGDWAPYRHGRWVWRGGDYVWVGYEPWGWAPYHYGRWVFTAHIGWLWVPPARGDIFWAPGYVGWVRTGNHVAWVPLAPREVYYGRGNYGRYSRNIRNVNIDRFRVTQVYRNIHVTNSITVVHQTTFVTGRPSPVDRNVVVNVREDFARRRNVVVGNPRIKPVEASYVPVVRQIPEAKRPPTAVRKIDVREQRRSRPLVRDPDRSALRPRAKPRSLAVRKVDQPRSFDERARERRQAPPPLRGSTQEEPAERGRRKEAPAERGRPQRTTPPEKARPQRTAPPEKARPQVVPAERGRPQQTVPAERGRPQRMAPPEKARPQVVPAERGRPQQTAPAERGRPQKAPADNVLRENRRGGAVREGAKDRR